MGDKSSLRQYITDVTGIAESALKGTSLSRLSVDERFAWIAERQTKLEEDMAYSLLGIFHVHMPLIYGEGGDHAFKRLREVIDEPFNSLLQHLRITDPRHDKRRIEETKGGLLHDSCQWLLDSPDYQQLRHDPECRLLWISGDPGKGKTMLMCGIVNEFTKSVALNRLFAFFFCQAADLRINSATAVLRGLIYLLIDQQPSLIVHVTKRHGYIDKTTY